MVKRCSSRSQPRPKRGFVTLAETPCPATPPGNPRPIAAGRSPGGCPRRARGHRESTPTAAQLALPRPTRWCAPTAAKRPELQKTHTDDHQPAADIAVTVQGPPGRRASIHRVALADREARCSTRHEPSRRACPPGRCPRGDHRRRNRQPRDSVLERACNRAC